MRLAIVSDIHSNLQAWEAVLEEIDGREIETIYCLGDVVGYGADPAPCVELVRERCAGVVMGNHDKAVVDKKTAGGLPREGKLAVKHNRKQLSAEQIEFLAGLPLRLEAEQCTFVHATPQDPEAWHRIGAFSVTQKQFEYFETDVCFIGHTHVPGLVADRVGTLALRRGHRYLINPGSVGQPRDGDPRASFVVFDPDAFTHEQVRVEYDVERAGTRIIKEGLPKILAERLKRGL